MKKNILFLLLFIVGTMGSVKAQQIIACNGSFSASPNYSISWTIGETVIETFQTSNVILTQGFQQTFLNNIKINELLNEINVNVYPNPSKDFVNIMITNVLKEENKVELYNSLGQLLIKNENIFQIDISNYPNGIYFLKVQVINNFSTVKIIKK
jgi:hypothetical protein